MKNNSRLVDRAVAGDHRVTPACPGLKKKERSEIEGLRGQNFPTAIGLMFRIPIVFIFGKDTLIQLASATTMDGRPKPVDTKISGYIIPVGIKVRDNDHLAKTLQHQRQKKKDNHHSLTGTPPAWNRCIHKRSCVISNNNRRRVLTHSKGNRSGRREKTERPILGAVVKVTGRMIDH